MYEHEECGSARRMIKSAKMQGVASASDDEQNHVRSLAEPQETVSQTLIRLAQSTASPISIIPLQDYLGLGEEARMNVPGQKGRNWSWKFTWQDFVR